MKFWIFLFSCGALIQLSAQTNLVVTPIDTFESKIHFRNAGDSIIFKSELRNLIQVPGGRKPYYTYLWDFGDGHFSTQAEPRHLYKNSGNYDVTLYAINNYEDGPKPKRPTRPIQVVQSLAYTPPASSFEQNFFSSNGIFQLFKRSDAKPGEDIALVVGVNSAGKKGKIYLLSNEKLAGLDGFKLAHQSDYYNETIDTLLVSHSLESMWANVKQSTFTKTGSPDYGIKEVTVFQQQQQAISYFQNLYGAYNSLSSYDIDPSKGETQFSLINLDVTQDMLVDTNAIVTITGVFIPEDGIANVHQIDIPVVKSHDPNKMSVRPGRMSYRFQKKNKTLTYKVQFQNDGEGDAKNVRLEMFFPEEINKETFKLKALYPACDTCLTSNTAGCYQYYVKDDGTFVFHFKDIALPGTAAKDISDVDSTKGFVLFTIETSKKLKNKSFPAFTNIYFDKNPPIKTNTATTRFRKTLSPLITLGSGKTFGTPKEHGVEQTFKPGVQFGIGLSPTAPYRKPYWQVELYSSYFQQSTSYPLRDEFGTIEIERDGRVVKQEYQSIERSTKQDFVSIQIPIQIRYNFSSWISAGLGVSTRKDFNIRNDAMTNYHYQHAAAGIRGITTINTSDANVHSGLKINPFADINIGRTYLGPALGIRISHDKDQNKHVGLYGIWRF